MSDRDDGQIPTFSILGTLGVYRNRGLLMRQYVFVGKGDEVPTFSSLRFPVYRSVCWLHHMATDAQHHGKVDHVERPIDSQLKRVGDLPILFKLSKASVWVLR